MLTLFAIPKPFTRDAHIATIQRNALGSWRALRPAAQIILCGDDPGVAEAAAACGALHIGGIARNEYGTPLLSDAFARAEQAAAHDVLCYANADIMFLSDFPAALQTVRAAFPRFLVVGQRHDLDITAPLDFTAPDWEAALRQQVAAHGVLQRFDYIDYFAFTRGAVGRLPDFAVGRPGWDNWFIYRARALGLPVIDGTEAICAVHQNHDYRHVPQRTGAAWEGPEAERNRALMGGKAHRFYVHDATHVLRGGRVVPALDDVYLERRASRGAALRTGSDPLTRLRNRALAAVGRRKGLLPRVLWRWLIMRL